MQNSTAGTGQPLNDRLGKSWKSRGTGDGERRRIQDRGGGGGVSGFIKFQILKNIFFFFFFFFFFEIWPEIGIRFTDTVL